MRYWDYIEEGEVMYDMAEPAPQHYYILYEEDGNGDTVIAGLCRDPGGDRSQWMVLFNPRLFGARPDGSSKEVFISGELTLLEAKAEVEKLCEAPNASQG